jgi:hypothetical protein
LSGDRVFDVGANIGLFTLFTLFAVRWIDGSRPYAGEGRRPCA